jgi:signal transduction histidine kinase
VTQVLSNLIGNAVKFTSPGGSIHTHLLIANEYIELSIKDSGRGIPSAEIPRLFERFSRVSEAPGGESIGTGLGLMIVKEIVQAHGGIIGVDSEVGIGRFWFRLPRVFKSESV